MTRTNRVTPPAFAFALALCLAPCAAARGRQCGETPDPSKGFLLARRTRADVTPDRAAFEFEANGFSYHVGANGNGRRTKGDRTRRFNLRLDGRDYIEGIYFGVYDGDLFLVCPVNDTVASAGLVLRLEQPSMRVLWRQHVPTFNLGLPLREGSDLYLTGFGFVARLDLRTGEYVWRHDDLDDFNSFETPVLAGDTVRFRATPSYNQRKTIVVNKKTGEIISIR